MRSQAQRNDQCNSILQGLVQDMARLGRIPEAQRQLIALTEDLNTAVVTLEERSRSTTTTVTRRDQVISSHFATNSGNETVDATMSGNNVNSASSTTISTESVSKLKLQFQDSRRQAARQNVSAHVIEERDTNRHHLHGNYLVKFPWAFLIFRSSLLLVQISAVIRNRPFRRPSRTTCLPCS